MFDIKGTILDSLTSTNVPQGVHDPQEHTTAENDIRNVRSQHHDHKNNTTTPPRSHDITAPAVFTTPDVTITTAAVESPPVSVVPAEGATTSTTPPPSATNVASEADAQQASSTDNNSNADLQQSRQAKEEEEKETSCINCEGPSGSIVKTEVSSKDLPAPLDTTLLYFAKAESEQEMLELCRTFDPQRQVTETKSPFLILLSR